MIIKAGTGTLRLASPLNYAGGTTIAGGTLRLDSTLGSGGAGVSILADAILDARASVNRAVLGSANSSTINVNAGGISLGDSASFTGFSHAGTLAVGGNNVTLNCAGFAQLGVLTNLSGSTISAPNGLSFGSGPNLSGFGTVDAKVAASFGSVIQATGALQLGKASSAAGFQSDGELRIGSNVVTILDANLVIADRIVNKPGAVIVAGSRCAFTTAC